MAGERSHHFPGHVSGAAGASLAGNALASGTWSLDVVDIRSFTTDKHRSVDDTPAGGGPGMVMKADVLGRAVDATAADARPRLLLSPRGVPLTQARVETLAGGTGAILVCGRFEGVDERVIAARGLEEVSIGDYVLSGGEIAAMALIDAGVRFLPGVMGAAASGAEESFADGLLEYPQYTRPQLWEDRPIPEVLTSGDHAKIAAWRHAEAERLTKNAGPICSGRPFYGVSETGRGRGDGRVTKAAGWRRRSCANPRTLGRTGANEAQPMENSP